MQKKKKKKIPFVFCFPFKTIVSVQVYIRLLTLLVAADGDLRVSLHVHHDPALPVSLGVDRHLVACSTKRRSDTSVIH